jgi:hypothetical protein
MLIATKGTNICNSSVLVAATTRPLTVMSPSMPCGNTARRNSAQKPMMPVSIQYSIRIWNMSQPQ